MRKVNCAVLIDQSCLRQAAFWWGLGWLFTLVSYFGCATAWGDEKEDFFEAKIRPVLVERCLECHSKELSENGLRLDSREKVFAGGDSGSALDLNSPDQSLLLQAIEHRGELEMPPDGKLSDSQIADFRRWIAEGAIWPDSSPLSTGVKETVVTDSDRAHWAFQPIRPPAPSKVVESDRRRTGVDDFVIRKLSAAGLEIAPEADRRTLIRRLQVDLHGLPPTWEEVAAYEADTSADAYEQLVERLLKSPRYGERWGRHWLDVARYADTKDGVLMYGDDRIRPFAYTYRDYVIRAFNEDTPFDQFVIEQLAADLIQPPVEKWRLGGLGFLTLGRMFDGNIHDCIDDQIDVVTRGLLGVTASCARCHDHKFDPVPISDYYALYGVFANCETPLELPLIEEVASDAGQKFEQEVLPKREALRAFQEEQYQLHTETARQRVGDYLVHVATQPPDPMESAIYFRSLTPEELRVQFIARWRRLLEVRLNKADPVFGVWARCLPANENVAAASSFASETWIQAMNDSRAQVPGVESGQINPIVLAWLEKATVQSVSELATAYGELLKDIYGKYQACLSGGTSPDASPEFQQLLSLMVGQSSPTWFPKSQTNRYMSRSETDAFHGKIVELDRLTTQNASAPARAMMLAESESVYQPHVFRRGNPSQPGKQVERHFLSVLESDPRPFGPGSGRMDLARAITDPGNPLTARVIVNRVWMWHFGEPLVATPSDFGRRCEQPVQIELLDYLAAELIRSGWSLKQLHREILLSSTYRQASTLEPDDAAKGNELDPHNRLYWKFNRQRLDVETFRDSLLATAGKLDLAAGGRPELGANNPESRRRTVYGLVDRQSLPGMFRNFDFASPDQSAERRPQTVVPQQALFALNSSFLVSRASEIAEQSSAASLSDSERIRWLYRKILVRNPNDQELQFCLTFLQSEAEPQQVTNRWNRLAQVLLASNEFLYVD